MAQQQSGPQLNDDAEYRRALEIIEERFLYVIQKKNPVTGQWIDDSVPIQGKKAATMHLNFEKKHHTNVEWRRIQINEAQKYKEGWEAMKRYAKGEVA